MTHFHFQALWNWAFLLFLSKTDPIFGLKSLLSQIQSQNIKMCVLLWSLGIIALSG